MADDTTNLTASSLARTEVPAIPGASNNYQAGGMDYLGMLKRLRQECGVSGSDPTGVTNLAAEMQRLTNYIKQAWLDIQSMHNNWKFMRQEIAFVTQADKRKYSAIEMLIPSYGDLQLDSFTIHTLDNVNDEMILPYMEYETYKVMYMFGARRTQTDRPVVFTVDHQGDFLLGAIPNAQYQVRGEGYAMPTELVNSSDRPACPGQFHMAIVYRAMMLYGQYEAAAEVYSHGESEFKKMIARLAAHQLPTMTFGAPLA